MSAKSHLELVSKQKGVEVYQTESVINFMYSAKAFEIAFFDLKSVASNETKRISQKADLERSMKKISSNINKITKSFELGMSQGSKEMFLAIGEYVNSITDLVIQLDGNTEEMENLYSILHAYVHEREKLRVVDDSRNHLYFDYLSFSKQVKQVLLDEYPKLKLNCKTEIDDENESVVFTLKEGNKIKGKLHVDLLNKKPKLDRLIIAQKSLKKILGLIG